MSLLPWAFDIPLRVTDNNGRSSKSTRLSKARSAEEKALQLHEADEKRLQASSASELVLTHLPTILFVEVEGEGMPQYPGLPKQWFPIRLSIQSW